MLLSRDGHGDIKNLIGNLKKNSSIFIAALIVFDFPQTNVQDFAVCMKQFMKLFSL